MEKYRSHKKKSHSRYSVKKGKRLRQRTNQYALKTKPTESITTVENNSVVEEKKVVKQAANRFNFLQKEREAKLLRKKKIEKASKKLEKAKTKYAIVKSDYTDTSADIKTKITELKQEAKNQKKVLKEAKKNLKASKKEMKESSKKHLGIFSSILAVLFFGFGVLLFAVVQWLFRTWPNLRMDELMYEATAPLEGTGSNMIDAFVQQAVVPMAIAMVAAVLVIVLLTKAGKLFRRIGKSILVIASCICIGIASTTFWNRLDVSTYVENQTTSSDFIKNEYVDPSTTELTFPEQKRNLIYIYCESMEMSFADKAKGGARDENVIPRLTALAEENEDFNGGDTSTLNGAISMPYTTWTMGGLFAATSGLPLQTDVGRNTMDTQTTFFPGITTLGDILEEEGYNQMFSCGSPVSFGGRELYFSEHGNYTFHDYTYALANGLIPSNYYVWWGFEDKKLIEMAKNDITQLASQDKPFNYTMLTVDTHFEDGYLDETATNEFNDHYSNVFFNSDKQVTEFVEWCKTQPWYDNTTIIISGDHPTMDSDYMNDIDPDYQRRVYTCYINSATSVTEEKKRTFTTFDNFPTTLAALGVQIQGDRLGLGTNLFSTKETLTEKYGVDTEKGELNKKSTFMSELSGNDVSSDEFQEYLNSEGIRSSTVYLDAYDASAKTATLAIDDIFYIGGLIDYVSVDVTHPDGTQQHVKAVQDENSGKYLATIDVSSGGIENQNISVDAHVRIDDSDALKTQNIYTYSGNLGVIACDENLLYETLHSAAALDQNRYAIFVTTQGNAFAELMDSEKNELIRLGMPESFFAEEDNTRYAVFSKGTTVLKQGVGYIRDNGTLANGTAYSISSADASGSYSTITVGNSWSNLTNYKDGLHVVIYDMQAANVVGTCNFNTAERPWHANLYANYDADANTITFHADGAENAAGGQLDVEVVIWNKDDIKNKMEVGMSSSNNSEWSVTIDRDDMNLDDLYAVCYLRSRKSNWHRVDEGVVDALVEEGKTITPIVSEDNTQTVNEEDGVPPVQEEQ